MLMLLFTSIQKERRERCEKKIALAAQMPISPYCQRGPTAANPTQFSEVACAYVLDTTPAKTICIALLPR